MKQKVQLLVFVVTSAGLLALISTLLMWHTPALADEAVNATVSALDPAVLKWGYMAAALVIAVAALGAAYAVANVGVAAIGALAEKPELFGRVIILVGLAEGIAIYGVIISVLILNRLG